LGSLHLSSPKCIPKRLTAPALTVRDLPKIDIVLLSHAHFDHFDMRTLHRFDRSTTVITAGRTRDLLRWTRFRDVSELRWKERKSVSTSAGKIDITAFRVKHWGARKQRDIYRGYNGYVFERNNRRIIFSGDTALSDSFAELRASSPIDLAIMPIGAYNPWSPTVSPGSRIPMRGKRTGSVRIFIPKKLINTVACPSHATVIRLSLHSAGFGRAKAGAIGRHLSPIHSCQR
jgi:L-ascorbate metabolism protein UlaG (beta-lactamase superfamily)